MQPILISNLINIRYLTGLEMTAGVMLLTRSKRLLFVDDRYVEKAKKECKRGIIVIHVKELPQYVKKFKRVRFEAHDLTVTRLNRWKKKFRGTLLISSEDVIEGLRRRKTSAEIKATEKACRITDRILKDIPKKLRVGIKEVELAWKIEEHARKLGAEEMAFETIVAFGSHTSHPHHRPTQRKMKKGDLVQIDMGVKVEGYCSDCSRVFFTKKPTEKQKGVFDLLVNVTKECTKKSKVGMQNSALDKYARDELKKAGYGDNFLHSLGHGVGLEVHEGLNISSRTPKKTVLKQNEIITIEPGVYFGGKWGMRIEDTVRVTRRGGERMTKVKY